LPITHNALHRWKWALLLLLLLAAATDFFVRAPLRLLHGTEWNDFLSPYIQSRAWVGGHDPYSVETFVRLWPSGKPMFTFVRRDAAAGTLAFNRGVPSPYPITSFVVLAPFGLMPWEVAQVLWLLLNFSALAFIIVGLVALHGVPWRDPRAWLFSAFILALAPIHTGLFTENPILLVLGLGVSALWALKCGRVTLAAISLTLATCLKPQVGLCFMIFLLVKRRWKPVAVACGMSAVILGVAIARLGATGTPWWNSYLGISRSIFARGGINDFTPANPIWFHLINLQVAFFPLFARTTVANVVAVIVSVGLGGLWLMRALTAGDDSDDLLMLSAIGVISLLPVYHRFYDAGLLIFPIAWAVMGRKVPRNAAWSILGLSAFFIFPGAVLISQAAKRAHLSVEIVNSWWWRSFIVGHQAWALFCLAMILLIAMMILDQILELAKLAGTRAPNSWVRQSEPLEPLFGQ
jgi:hypothetical protein